MDGLDDLPRGERRLVEDLGCAGLKGFVDHVRHIGVGEHDDGDLQELGLSADFFQDFDTVHLGQHQIQQDDVRAEFLNPVEPALPVGRDLDLVALLFEPGLVDVGNDGIVLDDE